MTGDSRTTRSDIDVFMWEMCFYVVAFCVILILLVITCGVIQRFWGWVPNDDDMTVGLSCALSSNCVR